MSTGSGEQFISIEGLQSLADQYRRQATECNQIATFLSNQNGSLFWKSQAATIFQNDMGDYMKVLQRFREDFTALSKDLDARRNALIDSKNT